MGSGAWIRRISKDGQAREPRDYLLHKLHTFRCCSGLTVLKPVTLPPGRARLATKPDSTGSNVTGKTIGIVLVASLAASIDCVLPATMTSTLRLTARPQVRQGAPCFPSKPVLDVNVLSFDIAKLAQSLPEYRVIDRNFNESHVTYARDFLWLLRLRGERVNRRTVSNKSTLIRLIMDFSPYFHCSPVSAHCSPSSDDPSRPNRNLCYLTTAGRGGPLTLPAFVKLVDETAVVQFLDKAHIDKVLRFRSFRLWVRLTQRF